MKKLSLITFLSCFCFAFYFTSAQCTLTAKCSGGAWSSAATWSPGPGCGTVTVPSGSMAIVIPSCATVTVDINSPTYNSMFIYVYGNLNFQGGQKINLSANGYVFVANTGSLTGGNGGSKINIDGSTVWNGPGPTTGPLEYGSPPLPVEIVSLTAEKKNKNIEINWVTANETNNQYFAVLRSSDAENFEELGRVNGAGYSTTFLNYSFTDSKPHEGVSYYRLRQTDFNGNSKLSNVVAVNLKNVEILNFYPNPASEKSNIIINSPEEMQVSFVITSYEGKIVSVRDEKLNKGITTVNLNIANLVDGNYIFSIRGSGKTLSKKEFIKK